MSLHIYCSSLARVCVLCIDVFILRICYNVVISNLSTKFQQVLSQCLHRMKYDFPPLNGSYFVFRCIEHLPSGPSWCKPVGNPCTCERPFIRRVLLAATKLCPTRTCRWNSGRIPFAVLLVSQKILLSCDSQEMQVLEVFVPKDNSC